MTQQNPKTLTPEQEKLLALIVGKIEDAYTGKGVSFAMADFPAVMAAKKAITGRQDAGELLKAVIRKVDTKHPEILDSLMLWLGEAAAERARRAVGSKPPIDTTGERV